MRQIEEAVVNESKAEVIELKTDMCARIEQYLQERSKRSERTYTAYRTDIQQFIQAVFKKEMERVSKNDFERLTFDMLYEYFDNLYEERNKKTEERTYKNTSINRKISSITSLITRLKGMGLIDADINYLTLIDPLPDDTEEIEHMPLEVAYIYIEEAGRDLHKSKEKQALMMLAVDSGLRVGELLGLKRKNFIKTDGQIVVSGRGKVNKEFNVAISEELYEEIMSLLGNPKEKVFTLSAKNVIDMMNRMKKSLGYDDHNYTFHSFRKTSLTITYEVAGLLEAQKKGHHSSIDTTKRYIKKKDLMITGALSMGKDIKHDMYKTVDQSILLEALEGLSKDTQFILNLKINSVLKNKEKE